MAADIIKTNSSIYEMWFGKYLPRDDIHLKMNANVNIGNQGNCIKQHKILDDDQNYVFFIFRDCIFYIQLNQTTLTFYLRNSYAKVT